MDITQNDTDYQENQFKRPITSKSLVNDSKDEKQEEKGKIIDVSSYNNNCGLFALCLGIQLALQVKPTADTAKFPAFVKTIPQDSLKRYTHETADMGTKLRDEMYRALMADVSYKEDRYLDFINACRQYILTTNEKDSFPPDIAAFLEPTRESINKLLELWKREKLTGVPPSTKKQYAKLIEHPPLLKNYIEALSLELNKAINNPSEEKIKKIFSNYCLKEQTSVNHLIMQYRLYRAAWHYVKDGEIEKIGELNAKICHYFEEKFIFFIRQNEGLIVLFSYLKETTFDKDGNSKGMSIESEITSTLAALFVKKNIPSLDWQRIYESYCLYVKNSTEMLTGDELGCLAAHWNIQLEIEHRNGDVQKFYDRINNNQLQVRLCNPSLNHWQVRSISLSPRQSKHQPRQPNRVRKTFYEGRGGSRDEIQKKMSSIGVQIGSAYEGADSFFDALAQGCEKIGIMIPGESEQENCKKLRIIVSRYLQTIEKEESHWAKSAMENDAKKQKRQDFANSLKYAQYTKPEMTTIKNESAVAIAGRYNIEGRMLCEKLNIKIYVATIRSRGGIFLIEHNLVDCNSVQNLEVLENAKCHLEAIFEDQTILQVAFFQNHYVPLFKMHNTNNLPLSEIKRQEKIPPQPKLLDDKKKSKTILEMKLEEKKQEQPLNSTTNDVESLSSPTPYKQPTNVRWAHLESILMNNFALLVQTVNKYGGWHIPNEIKQQLFQKIKNKEKQEFINRVVGRNIVNEKGKKIFNQSPLAVEKFCLLKIKEIKHYLSNKGMSIKPSSPITLSFLEHFNDGVLVTIATVHFNEEDLADTIFHHVSIEVSEKPYKNTLDALKSSSWLRAFPNETVIRFADRNIEEQMSIRLYCKNIEYALASAIVKDNVRKNENFWEHFSLSYKPAESPDLNGIEIVKQQAAKIFSEIKDIELSDKYIKITGSRKDIDQAEYVKRILKNQAVGTGSLLYLPTGSGKTFIIFSAMAHHYCSLPKEKRRPYLVVTPKNVQSAWKDNIELLKEIESKNKLFGEELNYLEIEKTVDFDKYFKGEGGQSSQIILVTKDILANTIKNFFNSKLKSSQRLPEELLKRSGVLVGNNLVIGAEQGLWKEQILKIFSLLCTPQKGFASLSEKIGNLLTNKPPLSHDNDKFSDFSQRQDLKNNQNLKDELGHYFDESKTPEANFENFNEARSRPKHHSNNLLTRIADLSKKQSASQQTFESFMNHFGGIIADESQILFAKDKSKPIKGKRIKDKPIKDTPINCRDILFEMSSYYQTQSSINNPENRLVIAASATPWPNELKELQLHLTFLAPKLMKDYVYLQTYLFKQWGNLETAVNKFTVSNPNDTCINQLVDHVRTYLFQWIKIIFDVSVLYEKSSKNSANRINQKFLYIDCCEKHNVLIAQPKKSVPDDSAQDNVLQLIKLFYSGLLADGEEGDAIRQCREIVIKNLDKKIAIYTEKHGDAIILHNLIKGWFSDTSEILPIEMGFFYDGNFMKNSQGETNKTQKLLNTNRNVNRNAFNNIFEYEDYIHFLKERFNSKKLPHLNPINSYEKRFFPFYLVIKSVIENDKEKRKALLDSYSQSKGKGKGKTGSRLSLLTKKLYEAFHDPKEKIQEIIKKIEDIYTNRRECGFIKFMLLVARFENTSRTKIIYFEQVQGKDDMDWLAEFSKFLPDDAISKKNHSEQFAYFRDYIDYKVQNEYKVDDDELNSIQYSLLYYIHYLYINRVFIFGQAGTSGMRIDADIMFMFSGAWTEGKLTQIKGRFGRPKGVNPSRHCTIYAPLTNTSFELFILKYYILKSLYDNFVVEPTALSNRNICRPIFLARLLYQHCRLKHAPFINNSIREEIISVEAKLAQKYFTLSPLEKAEIITPAELLQQLNDFIKLIDEDKTESTDKTSPTAMLISPTSEIKTEENKSPQAIILIAESSPMPVDQKSHFLPINNDRDASPTVISEKAIKANGELSMPVIYPFASCEWDSKDRARLKKFYQSKTLYIMIVPSRGVDPDLTLEKFVTSLELTCDDAQILLLFAINHTDEIELGKIISGHQEFIKSWSASRKVFIKEIPFVWKKQDKIPFGRMRQHCLNYAHKAWEILTHELAVEKNKIALLSADGDIKLTKSCFSRLSEECKPNNNFYSLMVFGYEILVNGTAIESVELSEKNKKYFFTALANRISMNINSRMRDKSNKESATYDNYTGYPAEPLLALMPMLTSFLFEQFNQLSFLFSGSLFGDYDVEGRRLSKNLQKLCEGQKKKLTILCPDKKLENRPILMEFNRFETKSPLFKYLKEQLTREQLGLVISSLASQPQSIMKFRFMSQNIASFCNKRRHSIYQYTSYFYAKNVLILLNLGPNRMMIFADYLRRLFFEQTQPSQHDLTTFNVTIDNLDGFNRQTFNLLYTRNLDLGRKIFDQLIQWLKYTAHELSGWFKPEFIGEKTSHGYLPMALPENYPSKATALLSEEDSEFKLLMIIINELKIFMSKMIDCAVYDENNLKYTSLTCKYGELVYLGRTNLFYAIITYEDKKEFQTNNQRLLTKILSVYNANECMAVNVFIINHIPEIKFSQHIFGQYSVVEDLADNRLAMPKLLQHCPSLNEIKSDLSSVDKASSPNNDQPKIQVLRPDIGKHPKNQVAAIAAGRGLFSPAGTDNKKHRRETEPANRSVKHQKGEGSQIIKLTSISHEEGQSVSSVIPGVYAKP